ncbi:MAG TPA: DNA internalization-related competence protein ComEC/Rec2 [Chiayiivirga sp.]|nr:DNA internalization-related competence protein ComEC/Rec2 [Chiayiivirga sp.]
MNLRLDLPVAIGLLLGCSSAMALPQALPAPVCWGLIVLGLALIGRQKLRLPAALAIGLAWAVLMAGWGMAARLPHSLEGEDLTLRGTIAALPRESDGRVQFAFDIEQGLGPARPLAGRRIRLSWYRSAVLPLPGSHWQFRVRLKRPRGTLNPGGFDFERHALEQGIVATGYVRDGPENIELAAGGGVDGVRARLSTAIATAVSGPASRFVQALAVGDTRALTQDDWQVLRATGTAHLIAISGLHIGIVAGFGALLMRWWYRRVPALGLWVPLPQMAALSALLLATAYTALAGFGLPAFRTLLMIAAALFAVLLRRVFHPSQAFALALIVVLLVDPLAVLNAGFWLSFLGVAWLLWCLPRNRDVAGWRMLLSAQGVMSVGLLPLTVWFFGQASIAGPVCNLIAVPWVSLVVVPIALAGTALELCMAGAGTWLFQFAAWLMQMLWFLLEPVSRWHGAMVYLPTPNLVSATLALLGAGVVLLPRGAPGKYLAWLLFAPLLVPTFERPPPGAIDVTVLDVGQGLSVLIRSAHHAWLQDAGPAIGEHFDMGEMAVVPSLRALGVSRLDLMVVSHDDNDHAGGTAAVRRAYAPTQTVASRATLSNDEQSCEAGMQWQWDGLSLRVLHPPKFFPYLKNESSCVVRIEAGGRGLILLPGDISSLIEGRLLRESGDDLKSLALVVPHHGSRSSSSEAFIEAVAPTVAMIGSGYRNRFDLPRPDVLQRYRARGIDLFDTARTGAIHLRIDADGVHAPVTERQRRRALWREP